MTLKERKWRESNTFDRVNTGRGKVRRRGEKLAFTRKEIGSRLVRTGNAERGDNSTLAQER